MKYNFIIINDIAFFLDIFSTKDLHTNTTEKDLFEKKILNVTQA